MQKVNNNRTMSGDSYYYFHGQSTGNYAANPAQSWNGWNLEQQQYLQNYARNSAAYHSSTLSHNSHSSSHGSSHTTLRSQNYHNSPSHTNRSYYRNRYANLNSQYSANQQHGWQRNQNNYKRNRQDSSETEPQLKTTKKKKKPLSQNIPNKKEWTIEDAEQALMTEREYNKKSKNALIIKFPDQELNKEIVAQFHSSIENVHFQQPCTPRFCFVTLQESANPEEVISVLNKQKFGEGYLTVEYKKDREEDQAINAEDIDPLTLYVGNLAQEITKEDMVNMYPNCKRIDIGFAKKMKFTRYAFVGFRLVSDSIKAFKKTHNQQMYNKSLIVRFRRLHGTVGMPGESKPQNPPKNKEDSSDSAAVISDNVSLSENKKAGVTSPSRKKKQLLADIPEALEPLPKPVMTPSPTEKLFDNHASVREGMSLDHVKQEQPSPIDSDDEGNSKPMVSEYRSPFLLANLDEYVLNHKPKVKNEMKLHIKKEHDKDSSDKHSDVPRIKSEVTQESIRVKNEPYDSNDDIDWNDLYCDNGESDDDDNNVSSSVTDFDSLYESMVNHANKISSLKKSGP